MKILKRPVTKLIIRPNFDSMAFNQFLEDNYGVEKMDLDPDSYAHSVVYPSDAIVMAAGKSCYKSWAVGKKNMKEYIEHILQSGHGSVLEHVYFGFAVITSRAITHEIVRHRAGWAYSQESQRFCDEKDNAFMMPLSIQGDEKAESIWMTDMDGALESYIELTNTLFDKYSKDPKYADWSKTDLRKKVREASRGVLPNDTATLIHMTCNARGWRHFIEMRSSQHAEAGIRMVADSIWEQLVAEAPLLFSDYKPTHLLDGTYELTTQCSKV